MNIYRFNVITMREYIARNIRVYAVNEQIARKEIWSWLIQNDLLDRNLFYKVELVREQKA